MTVNPTQALGCLSLLPALPASLASLPGSCPSLSRKSCLECGPATGGLGVGAQPTGMVGTGAKARGQGMNVLLSPTGTVPGLPLRELGGVSTGSPAGRGLRGGAAEDRRSRCGQEEAAACR